MKKVGVVGCGLMGTGIAQVCAQSGYQVVVSEINDELLKKGMTSISSRLAKNVDKGKLSAEDRDSTLSRIKGTTNTKDFSDCDLVIEAIIEKMDLKQKIFAELDKVCPQKTILATNTSVLSIIEIAKATGRMDRVLGLHFFNPVSVMALVEAIKTIATGEDTLKIAIEFVKSLGKAVIVAKDTPGFVVNRQLAPFIFNAIRMLEAGVATREDIDAGVKLGLNHPIGPLQLADFIGLDTVYFGAIDMYDEFKEPQYSPPILLRKMVAAGWLGRKTGKGFYDYDKPA
ncbi:MAG: 3-hydroxybutyryl-CoA dehydrogenase [Deltaproteobacteria bacterium]|nr:3-hydroxybutyryl-CoA dehydrogenase [Deltaproteobacteria bacterium]